MGKILFIGEREKGYFVESVASKHDLEYDYIDSNGHMRYQINDILAHSGTTYMVFAIEQYIDSAEEIVSQIASICNCNGAEPIIYASGYMPTSNIIVELLQFGITEFIFATNLSDMKDQLEKCMNGYYAVNGIDELNKLTLVEAEEEAKENYNFKLIGVAGSMERIGTTTQALHIIKYLQTKGYKACYIQMNDSDFIETTKEWYGNHNCDEILGKLSFDTIDHFYKIEKISDIKKLGYDYYIYDYGAYFNPNFNKISFLEKDIKIFVIGCKPTELNASYQLIDSAFYDDVKYIISFADELDQEEMQDLMGNKIENAIAPKRCSEHYKLFDPEAYEKIIPVQDLTTSEEVKKKKWLFKWRK